MKKHGSWNGVNDGKSLHGWPQDHGIIIVSSCWLYKKPLLFRVCLWNLRLSSIILVHYNFHATNKTTVFFIIPGPICVTDFIYWSDWSPFSLLNCNLIEEEQKILGGVLIIRKQNLATCSVVLPAECADWFILTLLKMCLGNSSYKTSYNNDW